MKKKFLSYGICGILMLAGCIENDIPYPTVEGSIQALEVEGQCDSSGSSSTQTTISQTNLTATLYVNDTVDISKLRITKLTVSNNATLVIDSALCYNYSKFPTNGFASLDSIPVSSDTRVNFSSPVTLTLHTYQDYKWTITVEQVLNRSIILANQVGNAIIDDNNHNVIIYVAEEQSLDAIAVTSFTLGGAHGTVSPDPTASETFDFSSPVKFNVTKGWEDTATEWTVYVYQTDEDATTSGAFPMSTKAYLSGNIQSGKQPVIEYKKASDSEWTSLESSAISVSGVSYTATLSSLTPATSYQYRINIDDTTGETQTFTTAPATELTDGSFDNWHQSGKVYNPWASEGTSFWDTGNKGATVFSNSNSVPTDETCTGSGKAALLQSKSVGGVLAAGNIFTGTYVKTAGWNGELNFGREFNAFPSKLRINYKYTTSTIDKNRSDCSEYSWLVGKNDSCHIYIALTDWDEPMEIRTNPDDPQLFSKSDSHIIAYAELIKGETVSSWQQVDLELEYRYTNRTPKYILVVASASKYGDFFTGGSSSTLWVDNFELIYE